MEDVVVLNRKKFPFSECSKYCESILDRNGNIIINQDVAHKI